MSHPHSHVHQSGAGSRRGAPVVCIVGEEGKHRFGKTFVIGREPECDVCIEGAARVSRRHTEIRYEDGGWTVVDLNSANGTFLDGRRVEREPLPDQAEIRLGEAGPSFQVSVEGGASRPRPPATRPDLETPAESPSPANGALAARSPDLPSERQRAQARSDSEAGRPSTDRPSVPAEPPAARDTGPPEEDLSISRVMRHYFDDDGDGEAGERTQFIRKAYAQVQEKQRRQYGLVIGAALGIGVIAVLIAGWQVYRTQQLQASAEELFFQMREQDLALATQIAAGADITPEQLAEMTARRQRAAAAYEGFVEDLGVYRRLSEEERLIYRVARIFNESEFSIPGGFVREVQTYIRQWQRSNRFQLAVQHAEDRGKTEIIVRTLQQYGLPPEFFYLAMQESNFNTRAVGPWTRWGHAKGAWQFIPSTGEAYGLRAGPRVDDQVYDPQDQRHDFEAATVAAARYLLDIYTQLAQASGLLVCASYNWGEHRVAPRLDQLPPPGMERARAAMAGIPMNPQERSYWRFFTEYADRMPDETKGYVMNIFAAAVIGQNPRFFGIDMDNPLSKYLVEDSQSVALPRIDDRQSIDDASASELDALDEAPAAEPSAPRRLGRDALRER